MRGNQGRSQGTARGARKTWTTSRTRPRGSSYPWRSRGDSCKIRNSWENTGRDPSWRQRGGGQGRRNTRGSYRIEWSSRSDDGRQGCPASYWSCCQMEDKWSSRGAEKMNDILLEKQEFSPTVARRTWNPEGFYSEDWNEALQGEDDRMADAR